jgi:hypothetical protein
MTILRSRLSIFTCLSSSSSSRLSATVTWASLNFDLRGPRTIGCSFDISPDYSFVLVLSDLLFGHVIGRAFVRSGSGSLFHLILKARYFSALEILSDTCLMNVELCKTEIHQRLGGRSIMLISLTTSLSSYQRSSLSSDERQNASFPKPGSLFSTLRT